MPHRVSVSIAAVVVLFCILWVSCVASFGVMLLPVWAQDDRGSASPRGLRVTTDRSSIRVSEGSGALLEYRRGDVPFKPYVKRLLTPGGVNVLLDAPADHKHHHGLMLAIGVEKADFWSEASAEVPGAQRERSTRELPSRERGGLSWAGFSQELDWTDTRDRRVLMREHREVHVTRADDAGATLLTWKSRLEPPDGKTSAQLWGRHYFGLGMRFVRSMDKKGRFRNAGGTEGKVVRGDERLAPSRWCAYTAEVDGRPVTVAMFDHPENPRHPATWFTMRSPFAYVSATLNLKEKPMTLAGDRPIELSYGVALWDGRRNAAEIEALHRKWITSHSATSTRKK